MSVKAVCMVYDTKSELIADEDLREDMICLVLGRDNVNDGHGALYKIVAKSSINIANTEGFSISEQSTLFAKLITNTNLSEVINNLSTLLTNTSNAVTALTTHIDTVLTNMNNRISDFYNRFPNVNDIYDVSGTGDVIIALSANGTRYLYVSSGIADNRLFTINIDTENRWIVPSEFYVSDSITSITIPNVGTYNFNKNTNVLTIQLAIPVAREYVMYEY